MKSIQTISVDVTVIAEARQRLGNISKFCEEAMREALKVPQEDKPTDLSDANIKLAGKVAEIAELRVHISEMTKRAQDDKPARVIE